MLREIKPQSEHGISSLNLSPSFKVLCGTSLDGSAYLYDVRQEATSSTSIATLSGHSNSINTCLFLADDQLLTAGDDRRILQWDLRNPSAPTNSAVGGSAGSSLRDGIAVLTRSYDGANLVAACDDGVVATYVMEPTISSYSLLDKFLACDSTNVNDVLTFPFGYMTATEDCSLRCWRSNPDSAASSNGGAAATGQAKDDEDDEEAASGDVGETERLISNFDEFEFAVNHLAYDDGWVYAASAQFIFAAPFNTETTQFGDESKAFEGHSDYVRGIAMLPEGNLVTVSDDGSGIIWNKNTTAAVSTKTLHESMVMAMCVDLSTSSAPRLYSGSEDGTIREWQLPFS